MLSCSARVTMASIAKTTLDVCLTSATIVIAIHTGSLTFNVLILVRSAGQAAVLTAVWLITAKATVFAVCLSS